MDYSLYEIHLNNQYKAAPAFMSDSRTFTEWTPEHHIQEKSGLSNTQYRKYLVENAGKIMNFNFMSFADEQGYVPVESSNQMGTTPYLYSSTMDSATPMGYSGSELKDIYLSREQLNARKMSPYIHP